MDQRSEGRNVKRDGTSQIGHFLMEINGSGDGDGVHRFQMAMRLGETELSDAGTNFYMEADRAEDKFLSQSQ